jgi:transposase, IS6 family
MSVFKRRRFPAEIILQCVRWYCRLKRTGELKDTVQHRTSKYLNNRIEADHGALKRLIRPTRGFQSMKTAYATIKGFEIMRMIRRRHCILIEPGVTGEVRFVNKLFDLAA